MRIHLTKTLGLLCLLLSILAPAPSFALNALSDVNLTNDDRTKLMRAIILAEKYVRSDHTFYSVINAQSGALTAEEAKGKSEDAQHFLAYVLSLEGVSDNQIHFYHMNDIGEDSASVGAGHGFLSNLAVPHAILVYDTLSKDRKPLTIFLDLTFVQFSLSLQSLNQTLAGKIITEQLSRFGFWTGTPQSISVYASHFKSTESATALLGNRHYLVNFSRLKQDYPAMTPAQRANAIGLGQVWGSTDSMVLEIVNSISEDDINSRVSGKRSLVGHHFNKLIKQIR